MKKFFPIILATVMLIAACTFVSLLFAEPRQHENFTPDSAATLTKEIPTPDFNAINASRAVRVVLTDQTGEIRIEADDNLMKWVVVEAEEDELRISIDKQLKSVGKDAVTVTVPVAGRTIRRLEASSAARISGPETMLQTTHLLVKASSAAKIEARFKAESCSADASSAAHIGLDIQAPKCQLEASSAAKIEAETEAAESCTARATSAAGIVLSGSTTYFEGESTSAGKISAGELVSTRASVKATSGSGITLNCTGELEAHASSGATIRYTGDCRVNAEKSSGGSIRKK